MKWTMTALALAGALTYAVIFLAQLSFTHPKAPDSSGPVQGVADAELEEREPITLPALSAPAATLSDAAGACDPDTASAVTADVDFGGRAWPLGVQAFTDGNDETARLALEQAVSEGEDRAYRHYLLGLTLRRLGEFEGAEAELRRSLELDPEAVRAWVNLARVALDRADTAAARAAVEAALDRELAFADAWHLLGRVELEEGKLDEAAAAFRKAVTLDPEHVWAWNNLGYVEIQRGDFDAAAQALISAVQRREEPVFLNNLGTALERLGREEAAALAFARAVVAGSAKAEVSYDRVLARVGQDIGGGIDAIAAWSHEDFVDRVADDRDPSGQAEAALAAVGSVQAVSGVETEGSQTQR